MKKLWIAAAVVAVVAVAVLLVILILPSGTTWDGGDEEDLYPYRFNQSDEGLRVTVKGDFPEDASWTAYTGNSMVALATEEEQDDDEAEFFLTPGLPGTADVTIRLIRDGLGDDFAEYRITISLSVDEDAVMHVDSNRGEALTVPVRSGDEADFAVTTNGQGVLKIGFRSGNWHCECNEPALYVLDGTNGVEVTGVAAGNYSLLLINSDDGREVRMQVSVSQDLAVHYVSHVLTAYQDVHDIPNVSDFESVFYALSVPAEATLERVGTANEPSRVDSTKTHYVGSLELDYQDKLWNYRVTIFGSMEDLCGDQIAGKQPRRSVVSNGMNVDIYEIGSGVLCCWKNYLDMAVAMECEDASVDEAEAALDVLTKVIKHE